MYRPNGESKPIRLRQTAPGRYEGSTEALQAGNYIVALNPRRGSKQLSPVIGGVSRATSPEFRAFESNTVVLDRIADMTGLLQSGVSILDALEITAKTAGNRVIQIAIRKSVVSIAEGDTITAPLKESGVFPVMVTQMIHVGEKTGGLDDMLSKIADFYDEEVDAAVSALTSIIEPVIIVFMGIVIGGILIAMYLPMFDIIGKIG